MQRKSGKDKKSSQSRFFPPPPPERAASGHPANGSCRAAGPPRWRSQSLNRSGVSSALSHPAQGWQNAIRANSLLAKTARKLSLSGSFCRGSNLVRNIFKRRFAVSFSVRTPLLFLEICQDSRVKSPCLAGKVRPNPASRQLSSKLPGNRYNSSGLVGVHSSEPWPRNPAST